MPEPYFQLALEDRREALEVAAQELGRDPDEERALAEEGMASELASWPES